ncbi:MAG: RraA family protein [Thermomicrobiales bacterium]
MTSSQGRQLTTDQLAFLQDVDSPTISNAIEPFKVRDRTDGFIGGAVRALFPDLGVMVGHALTVTVTNAPGPVADRAAYWRMWELAASMTGPLVVVMQDVSGAPSRVAYAGEVMATLAKQLGVVGMVTDGGYRDLHEVRALGMHYYAAYAVVSHANFSVVDVGVPVVLDGQRVETGDILHGDANGIVIVPPSVLDALPAAVQEVRDRERRTMDFIKSDAFSLEAVKAGRGY